MGKKKQKRVNSSTCSNKNRQQSLEIQFNTPSTEDEGSNHTQKEESSGNLCSNNVIPKEAQNENAQDSMAQIESNLSNKISSPLYRTFDLDNYDEDYTSDESTDDSFITVIENRSSSESSLEDACLSDDVDCSQQQSTDSKTKLELIEHEVNDEIKVKVIVNDHQPNQKQLSNALGVGLEPFNNRKRSRSLEDMNSKKVNSDVNSHQSNGTPYAGRKYIGLARKAAMCDEHVFIKMKYPIINFLIKAGKQFHALKHNKNCTINRSESEVPCSSKHPLRNSSERICSHCNEKHNLIETVGTTLNKLYPNLKVPPAVARTKIDDTLKEVISNPRRDFRSSRSIHSNLSCRNNRNVNKSDLKEEKFKRFEEKILVVKNNCYKDKSNKKQGENSVNQLINSTENHDQASSERPSSLNIIDNENDQNDTQKSASLTDSKGECRDSEKQKKNQQTSINSPHYVGNKIMKKKQKDNSITSDALLVTAIDKKQSNKTEKEESKRNQQKFNQVASTVSCTSTESNKGAIKKEAGKSSSRQTSIPSSVSSESNKEKSLKKMSRLEELWDKYTKSCRSKNNGDCPITGHVTKVTYIPGVGPYTGLMIPEFAFMDFSHFTCPEVQATNKKKKMVEVQEILHNKETRAKEKDFFAIQDKIEQRLKEFNKMEKDLMTKGTNFEEASKKFKEKISENLPPEDVDETTPWYSEWNEDDDTYNVLVACNKR